MIHPIALPLGTCGKRLGGVKFEIVDESRKNSDLEIAGSSIIYIGSIQVQFEKNSDFKLEIAGPSMAPFKYN